MRAEFGIGKRLVLSIKTRIFRQFIMMAELKEKLQSSQQQLLLLKGRRFIET